MVFSVDGETKEIVATILEGDITEQYECSLLFCDNPVCSCGTVYLNLTPAQHQDSSVSSHQVEIDINQTKLGYQDEKKVPREVLQFARSLLSKFDKADFQFLWETYFTYKNKISEEAPLDSIDAHFDYHEIEKNGFMSSYNHVLPYGDRMFVIMNGVTYIIFDHYCLLPDCPCTSTNLIIFAAVSEPEKAGKELCSMTLNYQEQLWGPLKEKTFSVPMKNFKSAIEEQIPDFYKSLLNRHIKLKGIYAHCKKKHFAPQQPLQVPKIGRNDPCPCGSGKKYKKCCMER